MPKDSVKFVRKTSDIYLFPYSKVKYIIQSRNTEMCIEFAWDSEIMSRLLTATAAEQSKWVVFTYWNDEMFIVDLQQAIESLTQ